MAAQERRWRGLWLAALAAALLASLAGGAADAHGGGTPQLTGVPAGPYRVYAWTTPEPWRVGAAHTTVAVTLLDAAGRETPVSGAQVTVLYAPAGGGEPLAAQAAEGSGAQAGFYEADADLPAAGAWQVTIQVAGAAGSGEAGFTNSVQLVESGVNWWLVAAGAAALALAAAAGLATQQANRRRTRAGAQRPAGSL